MKQFFVSFLIISGSQILIFFIPVFVIGFAIYFIEKTASKLLQRVVSFKATALILGVIGTPIHEIGHAFFNIIFRHRITSFNLFRKEGFIDGNMGYVNFNYNPGSTWQKIGLFFSGIGPIIFGSAIIALLIAFFLPNNKELFSNLWANLKNIDISFLGYFKILWYAIKLTFIAVFANAGTWQFWVFMPIALNISLNMSLSRPDVENVSYGVGFLIALMLIINIIYVGLFRFIKLDITASGLFYFDSILVIGLMFAFFGLVLAAIIVPIARRIKYR